MYQHQTRRGFIKCISIALLICVLVLSSNLFFSPVVAQEPTPTTDYPLRTIPGQQECLVGKKDDNGKYKTEQEKLAFGYKNEENELVAGQFTPTETWVWNQLCLGKGADLSSKLNRIYARALLLNSFFPDELKTIKENATKFLKGDENIDTTFSKNIIDAINDTIDAREKGKQNKEESLYYRENGLNRLSYLSNLVLEEDKIEELENNEGATEKQPRRFPKELENLIKYLNNVLFKSESTEKLKVAFLAEPEDELPESLYIARKLSKEDEKATSPDNLIEEIKACTTDNLYEEKLKECKENYIEIYKYYRKLSNNFLKTILLSEPFRSALPDKVIIRNAYFPEQIHLESAEITPELRLESSEFEETVNLSKIKTSKDFYLDGSRFHKNLLINNAVIQGSLFLRNSQITEDQLPPFIVDGELNLENTQVDKNIELAISDDHHDVKQKSIKNNSAYLNLFKVNKMLNLSSIQAQYLKLYFGQSSYKYTFSPSNLINLNLNLNGSDLSKDFEIYNLDHEGNNIVLPSDDNSKNEYPNGCQIDLSSFNYNKADSSGFNLIRSCLNAERENAIDNPFFNANKSQTKDNYSDLLGKEYISIYVEPNENKTDSELILQLKKDLKSKGLSEVSDDVAKDFLDRLRNFHATHNHNQEESNIDKWNSLSQSFAQAATVANRLGRYKDERDFLYKNHQLESKIEWEEHAFSPKAIELFIGDYLYGFGYKRLRTLRWFFLVWLFGTYLAYRQIYLKQDEMIQSARKVRDDELKDEKIENENLSDFGDNCKIVVTREFISADIDFISKIILNGKTPKHEGTGLSREDSKLFIENGIYVNFHEIPSLLAVNENQDKKHYKVLEKNDYKKFKIIKANGDLQDNKEIITYNPISNVYFKLILELDQENQTLDDCWKEVRKLLATVQARQKPDSINPECFKIGFCKDIFPGTGWWGIYDKKFDSSQNNFISCDVYLYNEDENQEKLDYPGLKPLLENRKPFWFYLLAFVSVGLIGFSLTTNSPQALWHYVLFAFVFTFVHILMLCFLEELEIKKILKRWDWEVLKRAVMFSLNELLPVIEIDTDLTNFVFDDSEGFTRLFFQIQRVIALVLAGILLPIFFLAG